MLVHVCEYNMCTYANIICVCMCVYIRCVLVCVCLHMCMRIYV